MDDSPHHQSPLPGKMENCGVPSPCPEPAKWKAALARSFWEDEEARWGRRMVRLASDMLVVCDEELAIRFHNRAFVRGIGHQHGSFVGASLYDFFPAPDRCDAIEAFEGLMAGRAAGMRISATMLTLKGRRQMDARVTRSRRSDSGFYLYFVIRDETERVKEMQELEQKSIDPILGGLPLGAFRTDHKLKVTHAFGTLWEEMGIQIPFLVGADLSDSDCYRGPHFLREIDYCDTMAGLTLHTEVEWKDEIYEITVEPFVDEHRKGKVIGTLGMLRKAKKVPKLIDADHLKFPKPEDYTGQIRPARHATRKVDLGPPSEMDEIARIRASIRPCPLSPADARTSSNNSADALALAN